MSTMPLNLGGLGVYRAEDIMVYDFVASRLQSTSLQSLLLRNSGVSSLGCSFTAAIDKFEQVCNSTICTQSSDLLAPGFMKILGSIYFDTVDSKLVGSYGLDERQMALWMNLKKPHTSGWLLTIPITGLGQSMNASMYRSVLQYRLGMQIFQTPSDIGLKYRHSIVRDILGDVCARDDWPVKKEVSLGFLSAEGGELKPADLLLYIWGNGMDVCMDVTWTSPFAGGFSVFLPGKAVKEAAQRKIRKYGDVCERHGYLLILFSFTALGEIAEDGSTLLKRIQTYAMSHFGGSKPTPYIFHRVGFSIMRGVGDQLVARLPSSML